MDDDKAESVTPKEFRFGWPCWNQKLAYWCLLWIHRMLCYLHRSCPGKSILVVLAWSTKWCQSSSHRFDKVGLLHWQAIQARGSETAYLFKTECMVYHMSYLYGLVAHTWFDQALVQLSNVFAWPAWPAWNGPPAIFSNSSPFALTDLICFFVFCWLCHCWVSSWRLWESHLL